jgi:hypothetical protein
MILYGLFQRRLQPEKPFIHGGGVVAIECDHLSAGLSSTDHLESGGLDTSEDGVGDGSGGLARESQLRPRTV